MKTEEVVVRRVTEYSPEVAAGIGRLMPFLSEGSDGSPVAENHLREVINSSDRDQLVAEMNGSIVGAATLNLMVTNRGRKSYLDEFVTDADIRGRGVGYKLWQAIGEWCLEHEAPKLSFTSNARREEAHKFYIRQGAKVKKTVAFSAEFDK